MSAPHAGGTGADPWADPARETEPGAPYAGPPASAAPPAAWPQPGYGPTPYGAAPYGAAPYGWPPYGAAPYGAPPWGAWGPPPPQAPRRPGQVIAAAVLAFVQAAVVAFASAYVFLLASVVSFTVGEVAASDEAGALATEATVLAAVQVGSVVALVVGGIMVLNRRTRAAWLTLVVALGVQLALALYWAVRLLTLLDDAGGAEPGAVLMFGVLCFAAPPGVALGLALTRAARGWFQDPPGDER